MRKISLFVLIFSFIVVFLAPISATAASSTAAATHDICGGLKADGITKGLFGLCVAYCEAGANSERVLENYNRKKKDSDPAMPCLEVSEPTLGCACWNTLTADEIGVDQAPVGCALDPTGDFIFYQNDTNVEFLVASEGTCSYFNSATGADVNLLGLTPEQEDQCHLEILDLAARDFSGFDCTP